MRHVLRVGHPELTGTGEAVDHEPPTGDVGLMIGVQVYLQVVGAAVVQQYKFAVWIIGVVGEISREGLLDVLSAAFAGGTENYSRNFTLIGQFSRFLFLSTQSGMNVRGGAAKLPRDSFPPLGLLDISMTYAVGVKD
jgi:hypothetical protein